MYEQGPIRPPSESKSLLLRVSRNCPWNRCAFCPVYKNSKFSKRSIPEIRADLQAMASEAQRVKELASSKGFKGTVDRVLMAEIYEHHPSLTPMAFWLYNGGSSIFLQDADSLFLPADFIREVLDMIKTYFPAVERITTYARSASVIKYSTEDLFALRKAGLNRIHIGLESGCNRVLELIKKGVSAEEHVEAGLKVKQAGITLSEYVMPGLGGKELWQEHAKDTAAVLSAINPDFIRLRTLAVHPATPLHDLKLQGSFTPLNDDEIIAELLLLISNLKGVESEILSDHSLNLLSEVNGKFPKDKEAMVNVLNTYLNLAKKDRDMFRLGKRAGYYQTLNDALNNWPDDSVVKLYERITADNVSVDEFIRSMILQLL